MANTVFSTSATFNLGLLSKGTVQVLNPVIIGSSTGIGPYGLNLYSSTGSFCSIECNPAQPTGGLQLYTPAAPSSYSNDVLVTQVFPQTITNQTMDNTYFTTTASFATNTMFLQNPSITGYLPTSLSYYELYHASVSFSNAWSQAVTIYIIRIGSFVSVSIPSMSNASPANAALTSPTGAIPTRMQPTTNKQFMGSGTNAAAYAPILILIETNGEIYIGPFNGSNGATPANFTASSAASVNSSTYHWVIGA